jgi:hypothetical protein
VGDLDPRRSHRHPASSAAAARLGTPPQPLPTPKVDNAAPAVPNKRRRSSTPAPSAPGAAATAADAGGSGGRELARGRRGCGGWAWPPGGALGSATGGRLGFLLYCELVGLLVLISFSYPIDT